MRKTNREKGYCTKLQGFHSWTLISFPRTPRIYTFTIKKIKWCRFTAIKISQPLNTFWVVWLSSLQTTGTLCLMTNQDRRLGSQGFLVLNGYSILSVLRRWKVRILHGTLIFLQLACQGRFIFWAMISANLNSYLTAFISHWTFYKIKKENDWHTL